VLREAGLSETAIERLAASGAIAPAPSRRAGRKPRGRK
jgi:hypothetical protein